MRPFQGFGHFCTGCGHTETAHSVTLNRCSSGECYQTQACVMPGCGCNRYYENGDA